jgi:hypothetical protein
VRTSPSGVKTKPEPDPARLADDAVTSILTTDGLTRSTAPVTAVEYASRREESSIDVGSFVLIELLGNGLARKAKRDSMLHLWVTDAGAAKKIQG